MANKENAISYSNQEQELNDELVAVLIAISVIARQLAKKITANQKSKEAESYE